MTIDRYDPEQIHRALAELGPFRLLDALGMSFRREGRAARLLCPFHAERTPSATLTIGPQGDLRLHCFGGCGRSWDALALVAHAEGLRLPAEFGRALERSAQIAGVAPLPEGWAPAPRREPPPPEPPRYAPEGEVLALLAASGLVSDDPECAPALRARGIDPGLVDDLGLAVAIPWGNALPRWAAKAGRSWPDLGYRLGLKCYAVLGPSEGQQSASPRVAGIRAWNVSPALPEGLPKRVAPSGCEMRGLFFACPTALRLLEAGKPARFVVAEGEPDFLSLATAAAAEGRGWGVLGVVAGSWTDALSTLIPSGSVVVTSTPADLAGERYAAQVAASAGARYHVVRARPPAGGDLNDAHRAGLLADWQPFAGAPAPGSRPKGETEWVDALGAFVAGFREGRPHLEPIPTGLRDLDDLLGGGPRPGDLWLLGGRTSMGKTSGGISMLVAHLLSPSPRGFFLASCETKTPDVVARALARQTGLPVSRLRGSEPGSEGEVELVTREGARLAARRGLLVEMKHTVEELAGRVAAYNAELREAGQRLGFVVVDYVQRVRRSSSRDDVRQHIMHVSDELKALAVAEDLCVFALSQVSREVEKREDKRPQCGDLKESGALEEDADGVIFFYRPHAYDESEDPGRAEILVRKNRHGPLGTVIVAWRPETSSFHDWEHFR